MSSNLIAAFNFVSKVNSRSMTIQRLGQTAQESIIVTPSNYFRNFAMPEEITSTGREFVITAEELSKTSIAEIKKGDRLTDPVFGLMMVDSTREIIITGSVAGYRVRTS